MQLQLHSSRTTWPASFSRRLPQNPLKGVTGGISGSVDPCAGVKSSDLDYYTPRPRAGGKLENGIDHITRNHILLDGSDEQILTPSKLPMLAQSKSKYLFQDGTLLSDPRTKTGSGLRFVRFVRN